MKDLTRERGKRGAEDRRSAQRPTNSDTQREARIDRAIASFMKGVFK